jgi:hypothetical protein
MGNLDQSLPYDVLFLQHEEQSRLQTTHDQFLVTQFKNPHLLRIIAMGLVSSYFWAQPPPRPAGDDTVIPPPQ